MRFPKNQGRTNIFLYPIMIFFIVYTVLIGSLAVQCLPITADFNIKPYYHGDEQVAKIALACNVFWGEEFIPPMLQILAQNNIKITFFIGGSWAKRFPDVLRDIYIHKHELANHSYSHPHTARLSKINNQLEITKAEALIKDITGYKTNIYSPPYGEYNNTVLAAADELGYKTTLWTIDTIDWQRPHPDIILSRIKKKLHNGAIILMHPTKSTVQALPAMLDEIQSRGYQIVTISELLQDNN